MSAQQFTHADMVDAIAAAISDSLDADWNSHTGAEAVVHDCGVFELYEALDELADRNGKHPAHHRALAALAKARGDA